MVDAIIGKWKSDSSKLQGYDEFRAAVASAQELPADPGTITLEISKNGDEWFFRNEKDGKELHTAVVKVGDQIVVKAPDGTEVKIQGCIEGNKFMSDLSLKGCDIHSVHYADGDELVQEQRIGTTILRNRLQRI